MHVRQFHNQNQFIVTIYDKDRGVFIKVFQSYNSEICEYDGVTLTLFSSMWDYSNTTRKHFKLFINEETRFTYIDRKQWLKEVENNPYIIVTE